MSYKEVLGTVDKFYEEPTRIVREMLDNDTIISIGTSLSMKKSYRDFKNNRCHSNHIKMAKDIREIFDEHITQCVYIEADTTKQENGYLNLIYWAFDMVDWLSITIEIFYTYEDYRNHSNGQKGEQNGTEK